MSILRTVLSADLLQITHNTFTDDNLFYLAYVSLQIE